MWGRFLSCANGDCNPLDKFTPNTVVMVVLEVIIVAEKGFRGERFCTKGILGGGKVARSGVVGGGLPNRGCRVMVSG